MEKLLSIVVPAYNVEKYIDKCLSSLVHEAVMDRIEVLVINDGSTDGTALSVQHYVREYPGTFQLINKENGGHGSTINCGIAHATGKYFKIVDGDDWLATEQLPEFIRILEEQDTDVIATDFLCIHDVTGAVMQEKHCTLDPALYGRVCSFTSGEIQSVIKMHSMTYRTKLLQTMPERIDEHCFYVDTEYVTYPMRSAADVYYSPMKLYMYRLGRNGQSVDIRSMQRNRAQHMHVLRQLLAFYDGLDADTDAHRRSYIASSIALVVENQFQIFISMGLCRGIYRELRAFDEALKTNQPEVYHATKKRSIDLLRACRYHILPIAAIGYKIIKR